MWTPNIDTDESNDLKISFDQYERQNNYGLTSLRPGKVPLDVDEEVYNDQIDLSTVRPDVRAELELESYRRKLGFPVKTERRQWPKDEVEEGDQLDREISRIIRKSGMEKEPANYRLNSKTTAKTALKLDKLPVAGVKNLFLSPDHFKFENPYVKSKPEPVKAKNEDSVGSIQQSSSEFDSSSADDGDQRPTRLSNSFKEMKIGPPGAEYVTPAQLYAIKGRRNR